MIKRRISSLLLGAAFAAAVSLAPSVMAACKGYCDDTYEGAAFSHCEKIFNADGSVAGVACHYKSLKPSTPG